MSLDSPVMLEPGQAERPTQAALLKITTEPTQMRVIAEAAVPEAQARRLCALPE